MSLARLLRPREIAVVGGSAAAEAVRQCRRLGFPGRIRAVHPRHRELAGVPCVPRLADLPAAPDAAFLAVNAVRTLELVAELSAMGAGGAVAFASGFAETGEEGARRQAALRRAAARMPLLGPNCHGFVHALERVALWPDQHGLRPLERGVALLSQSGNIAVTATMQRRALPLAAVITLGNQAVLGPSPLIEELAADPRITALGLVIERIDDRDRFADAVAAARAAGKPLVVLRLARTPEARQTALGHTASLAGEDLVASAFFARLGVPVLSSLPALLECLKLLHLHGPLPGRRIVSLSCSGGEAALMADAAARHGLRLPPFPAPCRAAVAEALEGRVAVRNPLDYHTFVWNRPERLRALFAAATAAPVDLALLLLDFPRPDRCRDEAWWCAVEAFAAGLHANGRRGAVLATLPEGLPEAHAEALAGMGLVPLCGVEEGLAAIAAAALAPPAPRFRFLAAPSAPGTPRLLSEAAAKRLLASFGLPVPEGRVVRSAAEARAAAEALGFPLVAKCGGAVAHKSDLGGVQLGLVDGEALAAAVSDLLALAPEVLVERMVEDGIAELILGIGRDPEFGLYLLLGSGGVLTELLADRRVLPLPSPAEEVARALRGLRVAPLFEGHRGRPPADLEAAVAAVLALQRFAEARAARLLELEVNPLILRPRGRGAVAADALLRILASPEGEPA